MIYAGRKKLLSLYPQHQLLQVATTTFLSTARLQSLLIYHPLQLSLVTLTDVFLGSNLLITLRSISYLSYNEKKKIKCFGRWEITRISYSALAGFSRPPHIIWDHAPNPPSPPDAYTLAPPRKEISLSRRFSVGRPAARTSVVSISKASAKPASNGRKGSS